MSDFRPQADRAAEGGRGHESYDVRFKGILLSGLALIAVAVTVQIGLRFVMDEFSREHRREQDARPAILRENQGQFPPPNLQPTPALDMARLRERQEHELNSYGWTDERNRLAHIPIERAMSLVVERGFSTRETGDPARRAEEAK